MHYFDSLISKVWISLQKFGARENNNLHKRFSQIDANNKVQIQKLHFSFLVHIYMRPEANSKQFEISHCFEMLFSLHGNLHGDFTAQLSKQ